MKAREWKKHEWVGRGGRIGMKQGRKGARGEERKGLRKAIGNLKSRLNP